MVNSYFRDKCFFYEVYPQSETPHLVTQIAYLDFSPSRVPPLAFLLPVTAIWWKACGDRFIFRVWDYRLNYSTSFSVDVDVDTKFKHNVEVFHSFQSTEINF